MCSVADRNQMRGSQGLTSSPNIYELGEHRRKVIYIGRAYQANALIEYFAELWERDGVENSTTKRSHLTPFHQEAFQITNYYSNRLPRRF